MPVIRLTLTSQPGACSNMGHFSAEIYATPGSLLSANLQPMPGEKPMSLHLCGVAIPAQRIRW
jgi:hypothetical protein